MPSTGTGVGALVDLDEQAAVGQRLRGAGDAAVQPLQRDRAAAAGQPDAVGDLGDRADACEVLLVPRHEQHAILIAGVDRQRERHAREDDDVVERDKKKATHQVFHFR